MRTKELLKESKSNIDFLRKERKLQKKKFVSDTLVVIEAFNSCKLYQEITFEDLSLFEIGQRVIVNEKVEFEKIYQDKNKITFLTYMIDGGSFGFHNHDCIEICKVIRGNLIEPERNYKTWSVGQEIIYSKNETHKPYATEESIYEVTFLKDFEY